MTTASAPGAAGQRFLSPPLVASVYDYSVSLLDEELSGHSAESIGRTCDEYTRHDFSPSSASVRIRGTALAILGSEPQTFVSRPRVPSDGTALRNHTASGHIPHRPTWENRGSL